MSSIVHYKGIRMRDDRIPLRHRSRGSTLIIMMGMVMVLVIVVGISFRLTQNVGRNADRGTNLTVAQMVAEGCLECQFSQWRSLCRSATQFAPPTSAFANISLPAASMFPISPSCTISNYKISAADAYLNPISGQPQGLSLDFGKNQIWQYIATVDVTVQGLGGSQTIGLSRVFQLVNRSPWSYAIFYDGNLEINPGAAMTVSGDVFTNSKLYTNLGGGFLQFNGSVAAVMGTVLTGNNYSFAKGPPSTGVAPQDPMGVSAVALSTTDTNPNNDDYHEIIERPVTTGTNIADPFTPTTVESSISTALTTQTVGKSVTIPPVLTYGSKTASIKVGGNTYTVGTSLTDTREASTVRLVNVDVGALKLLVDNSVIKTGTGGTANIPNQFNKGGMVVYVHQEDTGVLQGIRLINGTDLPAGGLTVVSDNPVYVMGDYNTGTTWQPAAVIGDAVTILSNNWAKNDSTYKNGTITNRIPAATTVNAAMMSGNVPTTTLGNNQTSNGYSGGVENFPRFLESWTGVTFTYMGSMVALYASEKATHAWPSTGQVYNAPNRNWSFDNRFINQPPPGSFTVTTYNKQRWMRRY